MKPVTQKHILFRACQGLTIVAALIFTVLTVYWGIPPTSNFQLAVSSAIGAAILFLLLGPIGRRAERNRFRLRSHLTRVASQVALLAGTYGTRQGVWLGDWSNARWRDLSADGTVCSYERLPLLVRLEDVRDSISNSINVQTGVPISEIEGMDLTLAHLQGGNFRAEEATNYATECLRRWKRFDVAFGERLLLIAVNALVRAEDSLAVGWEEIPCFPIPTDHWRLGARGLSQLSVVPVQSTDQARFHPPGPGDERWTVRFGSSGIWLLTGRPPLPGTPIEEKVQSLISQLMVDPTLRSLYERALEAENACRAAVTLLKGRLREVQTDGVCPYCDSLWIAAPED